MTSRWKNDDDTSFCSEDGLEDLLEDVLGEKVVRGPDQIKQLMKIASSKTLIDYTFTLKYLKYIAFNPYDLPPLTFEHVLHPFCLSHLMSLVNLTLTSLSITLNRLT